MTTGRRSQPTDSQESTQADLQHGATLDEEERKRTAKLLKRMRLQIWAGTLAGFFLALCIGAAFIAVVSCFTFYTYRWLTIVLHQTGRSMGQDRTDLGRCFLGCRQCHHHDYGYRFPQDG